MRRTDYGTLILEDGDLVWDAEMDSAGFLDGSTKQSPPFGGVGVVSVKVVPFGRERMVMVTLERPVSSLGGPLSSNTVSFNMEGAERRIRLPLSPEHLDIALRMVANRALPPLKGTFPIVSKMVYAKMMTADPTWGWIRVLRDMVERRRRRKPAKQGLQDVAADTKETESYIRFREALFWEILATEAASRGVPWTAAVDAARTKLDRTLRGSDSTLHAWV